MTWARRNLFNTWFNSALTILLGVVAAFVLVRLVRFVFVTGRWEVIRRNLTSILVGLFPRTELWRVWLALFVIVIAVGIFAGALRARALVHGMEQAVGSGIVRRVWPSLLLVGTLFVLRPSVVSAVLMVIVVVVALAAFRLGHAMGGQRFRQTAIVTVTLVGATYLLLARFGGSPAERWGGLMLTFALASAGILLSFPFGVALALGRRSSLPIVRWVCIGYIELIRGVPLITMLFMGSFVLGFVLPRGSQRPSLVTRAIVALVMFTAAYVAEIVRGGLQAVGHGQVDAAHAVGLSGVASLRFIVLPQALRAVIPGLVGQFITLFKDTSLVAIIGLTELLGISQKLTSQGDFVAQGLHAETLVFASFVYWTISYTMSRESQRLERRLGVGQR
jgi:general L-amino acid transport system permease protein